MEIVDITARIARYLPKFINPEGEISSKIFGTVASQLKAIYDEIEALKSDDRTGRGLILNANDKQIFFDLKEPYEEEKLLDLVETCLQVNEERATEAGLVNDLNNLHTEIDCDWEDITPAGDDIFHPVMDQTFYTDDWYGIDLHKVIVIEEGDGVRPLTAAQKDIIQRKFVPMDTTVIFR